MSSTPREYGQDVSHEKLSGVVPVTESGYIYVYLSNEEPTGTPVEVYFDDFKVTQVHGTLVAGGDYYPFGLPMETRQASQERYRFGYQGQFAEVWITYSLDRFTRRVIDFVVGPRTKEQVSRITNATLTTIPSKICTDGLSAYHGLVPSALHRIGHPHTRRIERCNLIFAHI